MTVWVYVDTSKQVGDEDHVRVFASADAARDWFTDNDTEGVAFAYPLMNEPSEQARHVVEEWKQAHNLSFLSPHLANDLAERIESAIGSTA